DQRLANQAPILAEVEHGRDVGVDDLGADERLLADPRALGLGARVLGVDDLDGDATSEPAIAGGVDVAGSAAADERLEEVAAVEEEAPEVGPARGLLDRGHRGLGPPGGRTGVTLYLFK